jgi:drug/metabolite transporter (DMT)-like permease
MLVVLTVLWGVNWPVMKAGVHDFAPITFRTLCRVGGIVLLAVVARAQGHSLRVRREHWRELVLLALTNVVIWYVLAIWGVKLPSSGRAARLGYTMPVWTALFGWWLYRGRLDARTGFGVLAAFAAGALLLGSELATLTGRPLGTLIMLGAAAAWGRQRRDRLGDRARDVGTLARHDRVVGHRLQRAPGVRRLAAAVVPVGVDPSAGRCGAASRDRRCRTSASG